MLTCSTECVAMIFVVGALRLPQLWDHKVFGVHKREQSNLCSFSLFSQQALCAGLLFPGNFAENFEQKKAIYTWWHKSKAEACELISDWYRLCSTACSGESSEKIVSVKDVQKKRISSKESTNSKPTFVIAQNLASFQCLLDLCHQCFKRFSLKT